MCVIWCCCCRYCRCCDGCFWRCLKCLKVLRDRGCSGNHASSVSYIRNPSQLRHLLFEELQLLDPTFLHILCRSSCYPSPLEANSSQGFHEAWVPPGRLLLPWRFGVWTMRHHLKIRKRNRHDQWKVSVKINQQVATACDSPSSIFAFIQQSPFLYSTGSSLAGVAASGCRGGEWSHPGQKSQLSMTRWIGLSKAVGLLIFPLQTCQFWMVIHHVDHQR